MEKYNIKVIISGDSYDVERYKKDCDKVEENLINQLKERGTADNFNISFEIQLTPVTCWTDKDREYCKAKNLISR